MTSKPYPYLDERLIWATPRYTIPRTACDAVEHSVFSDAFWTLHPVAMHLLRECRLPLVTCFEQRDRQVHLSWYSFDFLILTPDAADYISKLWRIAIPVTDEQRFQAKRGYFGYQGVAGYLAWNAQSAWDDFQRGERVLLWNTYCP